MRLRPRKAWLSAILISVAACHGCEERVHVADVAALGGQVDANDAAAGAAAWAAAKPGEQLYLGDAIRTAAAADATLALAGGGRLHVDEKSIVRFSANRANSKGKKGGFQLGIELGQAEVESGGTPITLDTIFGPTTIERGTKVQFLGANGGGLRFQVLVGAATVEAAGRTERFSEGQSFTVNVGGAIVERLTAVDAGAPAPTPAPVAAAPTPVEAAPEPPPVAVPEGSVEAVIAGAGTRIRGAGERDWREQAAGTAVLGAGTRVIVGSGGTVELRGANGHAVMHSGSEFTVGGASGALVNAVSGGLAVTSTGDTRIEVPGGSMLVRGTPTSAAVTELDVTRDGTRVAVSSGRAELNTSAGTSNVGAGETVTVKRDGAVEAAERAPTHVKMTLPAGEDATIHDPGAPTPVRITFANQCSGDGVVELARNGSFSHPMVSRGTGSANVLIQSTQRYRVRCFTGETLDADPKAQGTLRIVKDAGTQALPRSAPKTSVDADGRHYTVLYQTILPEISVTWPRAPQAAGYVFTVESSTGRSQTERSATSSATFPSGRFDEGTYTITVATADGAQKSRPTSMRIDFDDDTPVAYLRSPATNAPLTAPISVEGVAQEGASAAVNGQALPLDSQHRFRGSVAAPNDQECLAIRVSHPERGVHYYLRCGGAHP